MAPPTKAQPPVGGPGATRGAQLRLVRYHYSLPRSRSSATPRHPGVLALERELARLPLDDLLVQLGQLEALPEPLTSLAGPRLAAVVRELARRGREEVAA